MATASYLTSAELYDPATGTWSATGPLATARDDPHRHPAAQRPGAGGGGRWRQYLASAELYDPATGHLPVVKGLLDKGAEVNAKDNTGGTALKEAAVNGHTKVVNLLRRAGAR